MHVATNWYIRSPSNSKAVCCWCWDLRCLLQQQYLAQRVWRPLLLWDTSSWRVSAKDFGANLSLFFVAVLLPVARVVHACVRDNYRLRVLLRSALRQFAAHGCRLRAARVVDLLSPLERSVRRVLRFVVLCRCSTEPCLCLNT